MYRWLLSCFLFVNGISLSFGQLPIDTSYTVYQSFLKINKKFPYAVPVTDSVITTITEYRDIDYVRISDTRALKADVFVPKTSGAKPTILLIHGGGWRSGNKNMQVPLAQRLAAHGFVTIAVAYQLTGEAPYPAAVHNIKAAIRWAKKEAHRFQIDTSRMAVSGCSAGGQLAALVGLTNGVASLEGDLGESENITSNVQAVIDIDGVINFLAPTNLNLPRKPDAADVAWLGGTFEQVPHKWKEASAGYWATENTVPMLFINSGFPRFHAGQEELVAHLKQHQIYHEVHSFPIEVHPFWLFHPWFTPTVEIMSNFLRKVFE